MAKVHPGISSQSSSSSNYSEEKETYTLWMKSLVYNTNGFTVYDSRGNLTYRIDNYSSKCTTKVFLMDRYGQVLCALFNKKFRIMEQWNGYKGEGVKNKMPWFKVKKTRRIFRNGTEFSSRVTIEDENPQTSSFMKIQGSIHKLEFQIINGDGFLIAEVKRKEASLKGVMLGNDVLRLEVVPHVDHSLIMALVVVHGLMSPS